MRKKLKQTLCSVVLAATLGLTNCAASSGTDHQPNYQKLSRQSYHLRTYVQIENPITKEKLYSPFSYGTAFCIEKGFTSYFATAKHVVQLPENFEQENIPPGFVLKDVFYAISDGPHDTNLLDDKYLKLEELSETSDVAILSYDSRPLPTTQQNYFVDNQWIQRTTERGEPDLGEKVLSIGFPLNHGLTLELGYVAGEETHQMTGGPGFWASLDVLPGMSGAPVYEYDDEGNVKLLGLVSSSTNAWNKAYIILIDEVFKTLEEAKK